MTLWNIIRDWFVQYIFGGVLSNGTMVNSNIIGKGFISNNSWTLADTSLVFNVGKYSSDLNESVYLTMGDWLSTTSTIIVLVLLCAFLISCVIWLFKFFGGLFKW